MLYIINFKKGDGEMRDRIIPYSVNEMLLGEFVEKSVNIINAIKEKNASIDEMNIISDLINVKTYLVDEYILMHIENKTGLKKSEILRKINKIIVNWLENNVGEILKRKNYCVEDALWRELNSHDKYLEIIEGKAFFKSLRTKATRLKTCIKYKNVVKIFSEEISKYLFQNIDECIHILLTKYEKRIDVFKNNEIYIPIKFDPSSEIGLNNIASIVSKFIDNTKKNDYSKIEEMRLLSISRNLNLSNELKYLADKKYEQINNSFFEENRGNLYSFSVASSRDITFKEIDVDKKTLLLSEEWVEKHDDFKIRFIYNASTFVELMNRGRMNLDPFVEQTLFIDIIQEKGKNEYPINIYTSMLQMQVLSLMIYDKMLGEYEETLEFLLSKFYNEYIVEEFGYDSFDYSYDNSELNYRSKLILLLPVFDFTLRKIEYFLKNKTLDIGYLDFDDQTINYRTIKSAQSIKNVYLNPENKEFPFIYLHYLSNNLFIDKEYLSVYEAVKQGKVVYSELESHDRRKIDTFIEMSCLEINENGNIVFSDNIRPDIYKSLYFDDEIIYFDYGESTREIIDEDIENGILIFDDNFLSKRESDRYSYIMDVKQFSNSLNMRNRYSHKGSLKFDNSEMHHMQNYYTILMLFLQITLKFNIELCLIADLSNN